MIQVFAQSRRFLSVAVMLGNLVSLAGCSRPTYRTQHAGKLPEPDRIRPLEDALATNQINDASGVVRDVLRDALTSRLSEVVTLQDRKKHIHKASLIYICERLNTADNPFVQLHKLSYHDCSSGEVADSTVALLGYQPPKGMREEVPVIRQLRPDVLAVQQLRPYDHLEFHLVYQHDGEIFFATVPLRDDRTLDLPWFPTRAVLYAIAKGRHDRYWKKYVWLLLPP